MNTIQATLNLRRRTPAQKRISESQKRFNVGVWGRQSGKTTYGLDKMVYKPLQGRYDGIYWYILQTHSAAEVAFHRYWKLFDGCRDLLRRKPHETDKQFYLVNGINVFFKSGQNPEDLRVETLDGVVIDEVRQQKKELWTRVIRPMLAAKRGWADFLSTPDGFDHFYDLYNEAINNPEEWGAFHSPSSEAYWWTKEEVESARATMSEPEFAQEILAEFRNLTSGKAYLSYGPHNLRTTSPFTFDGSLISPHLPIVVGLDFNVNPMCWTLGQFRNEHSYWFDEIHVPNTNTQECAPILAERVKDHKAGVILIGDATGESRNTKATESDYAIIMNTLMEKGIKVFNRTPTINPPVKERVNTMNARLRAANGDVKIHMHPQCKYLTKDMERVVWKDGQSSILDQTTDSSLTHQSDSIGYPVCVLAPVNQTGSVGGLRVLSR